MSALTSNTFDGAVAGEAWWTGALFEMIVGNTIGIHAA